MHFTCLYPCHMTSPTARLSNTWHIPTTTLCYTVHIERIIFHSVVSRAGRISLEPIRSRMKANVSHLRLIDNWFLPSPATQGPAWMSLGGYKSSVHEAIITPCSSVFSVDQRSNRIVTTLSNRSESYREFCKSGLCDWSVWWDTVPAMDLNPLKPELNPICYLLALLGAHHLLHVSRIRVKSLTIRWLMSYIYGAPILDVSRSHTTTQHSR